MESLRWPPTVLHPNRIDPVSLDSTGGSSQRFLVAAGFVLPKPYPLPLTGLNRTALAAQAYGSHVPVKQRRWVGWKTET
jgi:hypothetical protein